MVHLDGYLYGRLRNPDLVAKKTNVFFSKMSAQNFVTLEKRNSFCFGRGNKSLKMRKNSNMR